MRPKKTTQLSIFKLSVTSYHSILLIINSFHYSFILSFVIIYLFIYKGDECILNSD